MTNRTAPPATAIDARLRALLLVEPMGAAGFTGRWVGGTAMVLGPVLMLAGALLRVRFHFFYPDQLAAYERHPALMATAYGLFAAGSVLLWPAVAVLATRIGSRSPGWGLWGGVLAVLGLFARRPEPGLPPARSLDGVTDRELEVLGLIARGLSNTEIAQHLQLSQATVKTHIGLLLAKLRARDRAQLVIVAYETGLVDARRRDA